MLVKQEVIGSEARKYLQEQLESQFPELEHGEGLDSVVSEVLNDKDLFIFLAQNLPEGKGLRLGSGSFWDDTTVYVHYGLTIDFKNTPRKTKLYAFNSFQLHGFNPYDFGLYSSFPRHHFRDDIISFPTSESFVADVNQVLKNPKPFLIDLPVENK